MSPAGNGTATSAYGILAKTGIGTLTLTNTQNLKREIQVSGGTLVLDYSTLPTGLLDDDAGISLRGGTLKLSGIGGTTTEVMGTAQRSVPTSAARQSSSAPTAEQWS